MLAALLRLGWKIKRQSGSHRTLARPDWPDYVFAFYDLEFKRAWNFAVCFFLDEGCEIFCVFVCFPNCLDLVYKQHLIIWIRG